MKECRGINCANLQACHLGGETRHPAPVSGKVISRRGRSHRGVKKQRAGGIFAGYAMALVRGQSQRRRSAYCERTEMLGGRAPHRMPGRGMAGLRRRHAASECAPATGSRERATSSIGAFRSKPTTSPPGPTLSAAILAVTPVPQAMSRTRQPGRNIALSTSFVAQGCNTTGTVNCW